MADDLAPEQLLTTQVALLIADDVPGDHEQPRQSILGYPLELAQGNDEGLSNHVISRVQADLPLRISVDLPSMRAE